MRTGYALRSPIAGWFGCRDGDNAKDVFVKRLTDACVFSSEDAAWEYATELSARHDGTMFMIFQVEVYAPRWRKLS